MAWGGNEFGQTGTGMEGSDLAHPRPVRGVGAGEHHRVVRWVGAGVCVFRVLCVCVCVVCVYCCVCM